MKLTIQHLAPYLPYKVLVGDGRTPFELTEHNFTNVYFYLTEIYLRPLSDLTKEDIVKFYGMTKSEAKNIEWEQWAQELKYLIEKGFRFQLKQFNYLFSMHFDVSGLIKQGLAIDINTIQK